jgi:hypothetical protein
MLTNGDVVARGVAAEEGPDAGLRLVMQHLTRQVMKLALWELSRTDLTLGHYGHLHVRSSVIGAHGSLDRTLTQRVSSWDQCIRSWLLLVHGLLTVGIEWPQLNASDTWMA